MVRSVDDGNFLVLDLPSSNYRSGHVESVCRFRFPQNKGDHRRTHGFDRTLLVAVNPNVWIIFVYTVGTPIGDASQPRDDSGWCIDFFLWSLWEEK